MPLITAAKNAIRSEIIRLEGILKQLEHAAILNPVAAKPAKAKTRGKGGAASDQKAVLAIIKAAGKINAVSLGHQLRKQGLAKVPTAKLIEAGVKVTGSKGGTVYSYAG